VTEAPNWNAPPDWNAPPPWADPWGEPRYFMGVTLRRVYAYCLDLVVVALLWGMVFIAGLILAALSLGLLWPAVVALLAVVPILYHTLTIASPRAATFGMRIAGIRVMSIDPASVLTGGRPAPWQALAQTVGFYASIALTGSLILAVALFNTRRRTLHDMLAGTVVVNDPTAWGGPKTS